MLISFFFFPFSPRHLDQLGYTLVLLPTQTVCLGGLDVVGNVTLVNVGRTMCLDWCKDWHLSPSLFRSSFLN